MKKAVAILIAILMFAVLASGCARRIRDRIGDKIAENIVEDMTGGAVDIEDGGENIIIETEEGSFSAGENVEWPGDSMGNLPKPNATVTGAMNTGQGCTVMFAGMSSDEAQQYKQSLKDLGYTEEALDMSEGESTWYTARNKDGALVTFTYTADSEDGTISYSPPGTT